jgi:hypothetical protein
MMVAAASSVSKMTRMVRLLFVLVLCTSVNVIKAAKVSGDVQLSGRQTEIILGSYAALPKGAYAQLDMISDGPYPQPGGTTLYFRAYRDTEWPTVQQQTLCTEKIKLALYEKPIEFKKITSTKKKKNKKLDAAAGSGSITPDKFEARADIEVHNHDPITEDPLERNHYWYFTIDDCSLEEYGHDNMVPKIHYTIHMRNFRIWKRHYIKYGEFSADDQNLFPIHAFSMFATSIVFGILILYIIYQLNFDLSKQYTVHAAVLWVTGAALLDIASGFCELLHLAQYNEDGIGNYTFDALSAHFEAQCDAMIMVLLLSIAAGWTLPSSVITVVVPGTTTTSRRANGTTNQMIVALQRLTSSLAHPISIGMKGPSGMLAIGVAIVQAILAQWGRIYNDNFDSYHDMDHLPGKILLFIRVVVGVLFICTVRYTASSPKCPPALSNFYRWYGFIGTTWFWALPVWVMYCHIALPHYKLKPYVFGGCCVLQGLSQIMLGILVTTQSTSYHQYSRMVAKNQRETLTDTLDISNNSTSSSNPSTTAQTATTWSIGRRAKVRLD